MAKDYRIVIDDTSIQSCNDVFDIVDPMWWTIEFHDDPETYALTGASFTPEQRQLHAMLWYMSEVHNGGHSQFYSNSTGMVWRCALEGFGHFGLPGFQAILAESVARFGEPPPSLDHGARNHRLDAIEGAGVHFDDLDEALWGLGESEAVLDLLLEYAKRNPATFHFDGVVRH